MQTVTETYLRLLNTPGVIKQHKAVIGGVEYLQDSIVGTPEIVHAIFASRTPGIGGCVAGQLELSVVPKGTIPRMAEIRLYTRLAGEVKGEALVSEWLQKGVFYIDTRQTDRVSGVVTIHGYDAMLKADQMFLSETTEDDWPKPMDEVVAEIAQRMGVTLDSRTVVSHTMTVGYPVGYTMRECLGFVGSAHAASWTITDSGQLRLVRLNELPAETFYLVSEDGDAILFGDTRILI